MPTWTTWTTEPIVRTLTDEQVAQLRPIYPAAKLEHLKGDVIPAATPFIERLQILMGTYDPNKYVEALWATPKTIYLANGTMIGIDADTRMYYRPLSIYIDGRHVYSGDKMYIKGLADPSEECSARQLLFSGLRVTVEGEISNLISVRHNQRGSTISPQHLTFEEPDRRLRMNALMFALLPSWRRRWCDSGLCGCRGCANGSGHLVAEGVTKEEWRAWLIQHDAEVIEQRVLDFYVGLEHSPTTARWLRCLHCFLEITATLCGYTPQKWNAAQTELTVFNDHHGCIWDPYNNAHQLFTLCASVGLTINYASRKVSCVVETPSPNGLERQFSSELDLLDVIMRTAVATYFVKKGEGHDLLV